MSTKAVQQLNANELLRRHRLYAGVYAKVARKLRIDASYVSRVAKGERTSDRVLRAILDELQRIERR